MHNLSTSRFAAVRRTFACLALFALALGGRVPSAFAQANSHPPERMTYQGYLVDANGNALGTNAPKNYDVVFRIWKSESSTAAADRLWTEQQTVTVDKGYFSVLLGEGSSIGEARPELSTLFTNSTASDRWVGLTVKGIGAGGADVNILPRLRLLTSPYAFLAKAVSGTGVVNANNIDPAIGLWSAAGGNVYRTSGNVGVGTSTPGFPLSFANVLGDKLSLWGLSGNSFGFGVQNSLLQIHTAASDADIAFGYGSSAAMTETMRIKGNGNVGIGTTNPDFPLTVQNGGGYGLVHKGSGVTLGTYVDGNGGWFGTQTLDPLRFFVGDGWSSMMLATNGNVGIGTDDPGVRLDVGGAIRVNNGATAPPANGVFGSAGTRLTLWPGDALNPPFGFGIAASTLWSGVPAGAAHRWFVGTGAKMQLNPGGGLAIYDGADNAGGLLSVGWGGFGNVTFNLKARATDDVILDAVRRNGSECFRLSDFGGGGFTLEVMQGTATKPGGGSWGVYSDARLKKDVKDLGGALDQLLKLRSVTYEYIDPAAAHDVPGRHTGFVAQEVEPYFPDWISTNHQGYLTLSIKGFEALTVQALRELRAEKDEALKHLADENAALRSAIAAQESRLAALEALLAPKASGAPQPK